MYGGSGSGYMSSGSTHSDALKRTSSQYNNHERDGYGAFTAMNSNGNSQNKFNLDDVQVNSDFQKLTLNGNSNSRQKRNFTIAQNSKNIIESPERSMSMKQPNNVSSQQVNGIQMSSNINRFSLSRIQPQITSQGPFHGLHNPKLYTCFMNSILQALIATPGFLS